VDVIEWLRINPFIFCVVNLEAAVRGDASDVVSSDVAMGRGDTEVVELDLGRCLEH